MRKHVLKQMMVALLMALVVPCVNAQVNVGDILCKGDTIVSPADYDTLNATAIGVVFYVDDSGEHGWAVALEDAGSFAWEAMARTPNWITILTEAQRLMILMAITTRRPSLN